MRISESYYAVCVSWLFELCIPKNAGSAGDMCALTRERESVRRFRESTWTRV